MTYYSVVQIVPDIIRGEVVNVAVVAFDLESGATEWRTLDNWSRVRTFVGPSCSTFERVVDELVTSARASEIADAASNWMGSVRITEPRASALPLEALAAQMASVMLKQKPRRRQTIRKTMVLREATVNLHRVIAREALRDVRVEVNREVSGSHADHQFDLAVMNGHVLLAAQAISFDRPKGRDVDKDINEIAWLIDDVRSSAVPPRLTVLVVPPKEGTRTDFERATTLFNELAAEVVALDGVRTWADSLPADLVTRISAEH